VTNPKQAIAIGLSEAGISKKAKGGEMKESKAMMKKEVSFMKKKGAPKSMIKHEMEDAGMKKGGGVKKMAMGGRAPLPQAINKPAGMAPSRAPIAQAINKPAGMAPQPVPRGSMGPKRMMAGGGLAAGHKSADGVASKGKTKAKQVVMRGAGKGMKKGGYC
jgi:hypothetical protein